MILVLGSACPAWGEFLFQGPEFQVNSYTTDAQFYPAVATDPSGGFIIVWGSGAGSWNPNPQDGSYFGIFGQRYNSLGVPIGDEFQANTFTTDYQDDPAVAFAPNGRFLVVWESWSGSLGTVNQDGSGIGVFAQRYDSMGTAVGGEFLVNTYTTDGQLDPDVAANPGGSFLVVWQNEGEIAGRRYDDVGGSLGGEFQVNVYTTGGQRFPAAAAGGDGGFVVIWRDGRRDGLFGRRYDSKGETLGEEFQVSAVGSRTYQGPPAVAADPNGKFMVVWAENNRDGSELGIFGQRYDSAGARSGSGFQVNTYTTFHQEKPVVAAHGNGGFLVMWVNHPPQDGHQSGVFGQRYDSAGVPRGSEFLVNTYTLYSQLTPALAGDGDGGFFAAWHGSSQDGSDWGVFGQRFATPATDLCGDLNCSGGVEVGDALLSAQFDAGLRGCGEGTFCCPRNCDIAPAPSGDGDCNIGDALLMAQCDAGLVPCDFGCPLFECPSP